MALSTQPHLLGSVVARFLRGPAGYLCGNAQVSAVEAAIEDTFHGHEVQLHNPVVKAAIASYC